MKLQTASKQHVQQDDTGQNARHNGGGKEHIPEPVDNLAIAAHGRVPVGRVRAACTKVSCVGGGAGLFESGATETTITVLETTARERVLDLTNYARMGAHGALPGRTDEDTHVLLITVAQYYGGDNGYEDEHNDDGGGHKDVDDAECLAEAFLSERDEGYDARDEEEGAQDNCSRSGG